MGFFAKRQSFPPENRRCAYIAAERWPPGRAPYCGAAVVPGSSYCAEHAALCLLDPASEAGAALTREQARAAASAPPPDLPLLHAVAAPEPEDGDDAIEDWRPMPATRDEEDEG